MRRLIVKEGLASPRAERSDADPGRRRGGTRPRRARLADYIIAHSPAQTMFRRRGAAHVAVLAYHGVADEESFHNQVAYLQRRMRPISLSDLIETLQGRRSLPRGAVLITFDDGNRSVADSAMPILRALSLPAAAFVIAGLLHEGLAWWEEVEQLIRQGGTVSGMERAKAPVMVRMLKRVSNERRIAAIAELRKTATAPARPIPQLRCEELPMLEEAGIAIANHTMTHPCLSTCSDEVVKQEVGEGHKVLSAALRHPPVAFAYPDGDCNPRVRAIVAEYGYQAAFLFDHRLAEFPPQDPLQISRLRVNSTTSMDRFRIILSGLHPALHRLRGGR